MLTALLKLLVRLLWTLCSTGRKALPTIEGLKLKSVRSSSASKQRGRVRPRGRQPDARRSLDALVERFHRRGQVMDFMDQPLHPEETQMMLGRCERPRSDRGRAPRT